MSRSTATFSIVTAAILVGGAAIGLWIDASRPPRHPRAAAPPRAAASAPDASTPPPIEVVPSTTSRFEGETTIYENDAWTVTAPSAWRRQREEAALTLQGPHGEWAGVDIEPFDGDLSRHVDQSIDERDGGPPAEIVRKRPITMLGRSGIDAEIEIDRAGVTLHFLSRWVTLDARRVVVVHCGRMGGALDDVRADCDAMLASLFVN